MNLLKKTGGERFMEVVTKKKHTTTIDESEEEGEVYEDMSESGRAWVGLGWVANCNAIRVLVLRATNALVASGRVALTLEGAARKTELKLVYVYT